MTNWRQTLREHDPGAERMSAHAAAQMRDTIVRAAGRPGPSAAVWPMRFALATFACMVLMLSILGTGRAREEAPSTVVPGAGTERRQIQFATPGGTRIIWELNPSFTLTETLP